MNLPTDFDDPVEYPQFAHHKCLNHGFVALVDVMGSDQSFVDAARVSYGKGTQAIRKDKGLISYLLRNRHTSPFEMAEMKFLCRMPMFVARQWIRHRTANVNEYSGRYSEMKPLFFVPHPGSIAEQSTKNHQGREELPIEDLLEKHNVTDIESDKILPTEKYWDLRWRALKRDPAFEAYALEVQDIIRKTNTRQYAEYKALLSLGTAKELSRTVLPLTTYTEWYWKIDLHNLLHFVALRADAHAQYEIQAYGRTLMDVVERWVPLTYRAFVEYRLEGAHLSRGQLEVVRRLLRGEAVDAAASGLSQREWAELQQVLADRA